MRSRLCCAIWLLGICACLAGCGGNKQAPQKSEAEVKTPEAKSAETKSTPAPEGALKTADAKSPALEAKAGESVNVVFGKSVLFTARMPKAWVAEEPENKMRTYQARIPKSGEAREDGQLQIFKMSAAGGVDETLKRWQTNQWGGADSMEERREVKTKLGAEATVAVFSGTYTAMDFSAEKKAPQENYMMLGAILPTSEGTFYIKLVGPRDTVDPQREAFEAMLASFDFKDKPREPEKKEPQP